MTGPDFEARQARYRVLREGVKVVVDGQECVFDHLDNPHYPHFLYARKDGVEGVLAIRLADVEEGRVLLEIGGGEIETDIYDEIANVLRKQRY